MSEPRPGIVADEKLLLQAIARLNAHVLGLVVGTMAGLLLFAATIVLVLKGGPNTGQHLWLLWNYFPGFGVTVKGAFVGFAYAFVIGYLAGYAVGLLYNRIVSLRGS